MISQDNINSLVKRIERANNIIIIPHRNPDGDAIGSTLALWHVLKKMGKNAQVISPNDYPPFLQWMPGVEQILAFESYPDDVKRLLNKSDLIFTLDFNALHRVGDQMQPCLEKLSADFIMIDHHQMPDDYAKITFSDVNYGSTCELLYDIINNSSLNQYFDKDVATCIYTGIVTDSGSFKFVKTTAHTHRVVAELIDYGVDNPQVHVNLFNNSSYSQLQLLGKALNQLKIIGNNKVAYTYLSQDDLCEFNYQKGDTEGIVNFGLSIKGVVMAVIFIEQKQEEIIKISFRSQGDIDVNQFARKHFNGGGHINAAGGKSFENLSQTIRKFETLINNEF